MRKKRSECPHGRRTGCAKAVCVVRLEPFFQLVAPSVYSSGRMQDVSEGRFLLTHIRNLCRTMRPRIAACSDSGRFPCHFARRRMRENGFFTGGSTVGRKWRSLTGRRLTFCHFARWAAAESVSGARYGTGCSVCSQSAAFPVLVLGISGYLINFARTKRTWK